MSVMHFNTKCLSDVVFTFGLMITVLCQVIVDLKTGLTPMNLDTSAELT